MGFLSADVGLLNRDDLLEKIYALVVLAKRVLSLPKGQTQDMLRRGTSQKDPVQNFG